MLAERARSVEIHAPDRVEFMHHAYNALFGGNVYHFPPHVQARVIAEIAQDLCALVRTMPKDFREEFVRDVVEQTTRSN
jgi:hypothetical protein